MRFGTTSIGDPDITETIDREIDDYKVHPKYKHNEPYFDVGIAYTKTKVEYTPYIRPICLPMNPIGKNIMPQKYITHTILIVYIRIKTASNGSNILSPDF